jgi:hypothetical protein
MKVDNRLRTAKLKMGYMIMLAVSFSLTAYFVFEKVQNIIMPIAILLIVLAYIILLARRSNYFFLEYIGNKVTVRYYSAHPFFRKYKAFEIPKSSLYDYQIKKKLFGFRETIQLVIKTPKGMFKFPPLSIVLLSPVQKAELIRILEEIKASQAL